MQKIKLIILYITSFVSINLSAQWNTIDLPKHIESINGYHFLSNDTGYIFTANSDSTVFKTIDGGINWIGLDSSESKLPAEITWIESVKFISKQIGFMQANIGSQKTIYRTLNAGNTWFQILNTYKISDFDFITKDIGVYCRGTSYYTTTDGGQNWINHYNRSLSVYSIKMVSENDIFFNINGQPYYSSDFGSSLSRSQEPSDLGTFSKIIFNGDDGLLISFNRIYQSTDKGQSWTKLTTNTVNMLQNISSIYKTSSNDLFIGSNLPRFSSDNGLHFGYQPLPEKPTNGYIGLFQENNGRVFSYHSGLKKLFYSDNLGGTTIDIRLGQTGIWNQCPGDTFVFKNLSTSQGNYSWFVEGVLVSNNFELEYIAPEQFGKSRYKVQMVFESDQISDTIETSFTSLAGTHIPFSAKLDSLETCKKLHRFKIHPYNSDYRYYLHDGTNLINIEDKIEASNDTAFVEIKLDLNNNYEVRAIPYYNWCSDTVSWASTQLKVTINPVEFDALEFTFEEQKYCVFDTVHATLSASVPGGKYWYDYSANWLSVDEIDTLSGTGGPIPFSFDGSTIEYNGLNIFYKHPDGCILTKGGVNIPREWRISVLYTKELNGRRSYQDVFELGDTVQIKRIKLPVDSIVTFDISNKDWNITLSHLNDTFFTPQTSGVFDIHQRLKSVNGCVYENNKSIIVGSPQDTSISSGACSVYPTELSRSRAIDMHKDNMGNYYKAGYVVDIIGNGPFFDPVYSFAKYDSNKHIIWRKGFSTKTHHHSSLYQHYYKNSFGTAISSDDEGNVYIGGKMENSTFLFDSLVYNPKEQYSPIYHYAFFAKLTPNGDVEWCYLTKSNTSSRFLKGPSIHGIEVIDKKIYVVGNFSSELWKTNDTLGWEPLTSLSGRNIVELTPEGEISKIEHIEHINQDEAHIQPERFSWMDQTTVGTYDLGTRVYKDKQNNIVLDFLSNAKSNYSFNRFQNNIFPRTVGTPPSSFYGWDVKSIAKWNPKSGWLNYEVIAVGDFEVHSEIYQPSILNDNHGNTYHFYNGNDPAADQVVEGPKSTAVLFKRDANGNEVWRNRFFDGTISDFKLSADEKHIIIANASSTTFVNTSEGASSISSKDGYTGNKILIFDHETGKLNTHRLSKYTNNVSLFFTNDDKNKIEVNTYDTDSSSFVSYPIDFGAANCNDTAFIIPLPDTLFTALGKGTRICNGSKVFIPWIATKGIEKVNIGYYKNYQSTKNYIEQNVAWNDFGAFWDVNVSNTVDSIFIFVENSTMEFSHVSGPIYLNTIDQIVDNNNLLACAGDTVLTNIIYSNYIYTYKENDFFIGNDDSELSFEIPNFASETPFFIRAETNNLLCAIEDTVWLNAKTITVNFIESTTPEGLVTLTNTSENVNAIEWLVMSELDTLIHYSESVDLETGQYTVCLAGRSECAIDTICDEFTILLVGIADRNKDLLSAKVYPTPTRDFITLKTNAQPENIQIFDLQGKAIPIDPFNKGRTIKINLNHLSQGTYVLKINLDGNEVTKKIIKN